MAAEQSAAYFRDLRNNRFTRPGGARPPPPSIIHQFDYHSIQDHEPYGGPESIQSHAIYGKLGVGGDGSLGQHHNVSPSLYRDLADSTDSTYLERGQPRSDEKHAVSLSRGPNGVGSGVIGNEPITEEHDDERRIYGQAMEEASDLIWDHQNGYLPPKPKYAYRYRTSISNGNPTRPGTLGEKSVTATVTPSRGGPDWSAVTKPAMSSCVPTRHRPTQEDVMSKQRPDLVWQHPPPSEAKPHPPQTDGRRHISSNSTSGENGHGLSKYDKWQEPEAEVRPNPPVLDPRQTTDRQRLPHQYPQSIRRADDAQIDRTAPVKVRHNSLSSIDIHRNPPSQSRNPLYRTNSPSYTSSAVKETEDPVSRKHGMEVRADYIREATSMRLKNRSSKLPTPTAVSDDPGRPIVSFQYDWKKSEVTANGSMPTDSDANSVILGKNALAAGINGGNTQSLPMIVLEPEPDPDLKLESAMPSISISEVEDAKPKPPLTDLPASTRHGIPKDQVPSIHIGSSQPEEARKQPPTRPLPHPVSSASGTSVRPLPTPGTKTLDQGEYQTTRQYRSRPRPIPASTKDSAACHECGLPIRGRFVALRGVHERFHPQCFSCVICGTGLEALEIHPEPEASRHERLERIQRRRRGEILDEEPGKTMAEDGDERLRFYCHLDWHELFAPKCKHCKTPILGEHIVALGAHWHEGHFFCAECGDPFQNGMTHIEKDGYAWCVKCQTKLTERRAPKCRKCKAAVIGQYIVAMGGEWHDSCFRCVSCNGAFEDGQIFPRTLSDGSTTVTCTKCRAMELKG